MNSKNSIIDFAEEVFNDLSKRKEVDQLETFCSSNIIRSLRIVNNEVLELRVIRDSGTGTRVMKQGFMGYSSKSTLTLEAARETYDTARRVANSSMGKKENFSFPKPENRFKETGNAGISFSDSKLRNLSEEELAESGRRIIDSASSHDKRIKDCSGSITIVSHEFAVINSNGVKSGDSGDYMYATLTSIAEDGEQRAQGFDTLVTRKYSKFKEEIDGVGKKSAEMSVKSLKSEQPQSGKYDIIYAPSCMSLTSMNLARMANAQRVHDGLSMFTNSLGNLVASKVVSIVDDGKFQDGMESSSIDDEGVPTRRTVIIEDGILRSFYFDSYTASKFGVQSTGNGYRVMSQIGGSTLQGKRYDFPPSCSSTNFIILPGDATKEEIIQDTKRGILLGWTRYERLLNSRTGAFTSNARSGNFLIENGEIKYPVHGFRVLDSYLNLLKSIDCISSSIEQKGHWGVASTSPAFRTRGIQIISM
jgi:PmbA protein